MSEHYGEEDRFPISWQTAFGTTKLSYIVEPRYRKLASLVEEGTLLLGVYVVPNDPERDHELVPLPRADWKPGVGLVVLEERNDLP